MTTLPVSLQKRFTVCPPAEQDIPQIIELVIALDMMHYGVADEYAPDDIRDDWSRLDLLTDAWAITSSDRRLAAYATVTDRGYGCIVADGYVHPDFQGLGIGTELVRLMETRAREKVDLAPEGVQVVLENSVLQSDLAARNILEDAGYSLARAFWRMAIEFQAPPSPSDWPAGIAPRAFVPGMERAVFDAVEEAFQDHWGHTPQDFAEWTERTRRDSFDPSLWFLAMDGDEIAGVALCRLRPDNTAWVNTVAVRRPWRKRGLATALLQEAFGALYRRDVHTAALGVDAQSLTGATRVYERAGMHISLRVATYQKILRPGLDLIFQRESDS
jgi:GNAT superfamily N-acetyltransferase